MFTPLQLPQQGMNYIIILSHVRHCYSQLKKKLVIFPDVPSHCDVCMHVKEYICSFISNCMSSLQKCLIVLTTEWLPWLQTSRGDGDYERLILVLARY